jgi:hypothetical protein
MLQKIALVQSGRAIAPSNPVGKWVQRRHVSHRTMAHRWIRRLHGGSQSITRGTGRYTGLRQAALDRPIAPGMHHGQHVLRGQFLLYFRNMGQAAQCHKNNKC